MDKLAKVELVNEIDDAIERLEKLREKIIPREEMRTNYSPPLRRSGKVRARLKYQGRSKPIPMPDPWENDY